jgi:hypothetical protein
MLGRMELDEHVPWTSAVPVGGAGAAGDNVVYSTNPGDVANSVPGNVKGTRRVKGWVQATQTATAKLQVPDGAGGWITINNGGAGDAVTANAWYEINFLRPAGAHRFVMNYATAPTWKHSDGFRLQVYP